MGPRGTAIWRNIVIGGGFGVGFFWGWELSPEHEVLASMGAPPEVHMLLSILSVIGLIATLLKALEYLRVFGLLAWVFGTMGGYAIAVGDPSTGIGLVVLAEVAIVLGFLSYGVTHRW